MARQPRLQYAGALYHMMARGNGGDLVFVTDDERKAFLHRLGQVGAGQKSFLGLKAVLFFEVDGV